MTARPTSSSPEPALPLTIGDVLYEMDVIRRSSGLINTVSDATLDAWIAALRSSSPRGAVAEGETEAGGEAEGVTLREVAKFLASKGVRAIANERMRQVTHEGWTPEHDDAHGNGEILKDGALPLLKALTGFYVAHDPWGLAKKHGGREHDRVRALTIAGALIAAEIDRLERARVVLESGEPAGGGEASNDDDHGPDQWPVGGGA